MPTRALTAVARWPRARMRSSAPLAMKIALAALSFKAPSPSECIAVAGPRVASSIGDRRLL
eukprot:6724069-Pyramimonas_sp.AAC.1